MATSVCFLHGLKYLNSSTKAGYLGEARSRRLRRYSLDAYVELRTLFSRRLVAQQRLLLQMGGTTCQSSSTFGPMESVSFARVHCLAGRVVPIGSQALDRHAFRHCSTATADLCGIQDGRG